MSEETNKEEASQASSKFNNVIDASAEFLKITFPHGYALVQKLRKKDKEQKDKNLTTQH
jgi:hypothetical protein